MYLLKPSWLGHKDEHRKFEIYSVSVSPDGKRLATGGLVRIWSTESIYDIINEEGDMNNKSAGNATNNVNGSNGSTSYSSNTANGPHGSLSKPRQLCSMSNHTGAVTVVRFSPNGKYLASGSDDRITLIWELDETRIPQREFGQEGTAADTESWVARKRLTGHENDIQDLAWAPDSSILVTVSLDSSILIWSGTTFEKLKRIDIHQSQVKGVTFDPANKYFATASDDRTMRIIRYHRESPGELTFSVEATITKPFEDSPISTYFRRCSWSPDGNHIAASNAVNGPVPTVAIINRGTWESDISLVGHEFPCEVASFCPKCFSDNKEQNQQQKNQQQKTIDSANANDGSAKPGHHTVVATSGQDKILAIWKTCNPRPLIVANNIAEKPISDIAWSPDGKSLFASSLDGTVTIAVFEDGELGWPVSTDAVTAQLLRFGGKKDAMQIPGSVEQIMLEDKIGELDKEASKQKMDALMGSTENNGIAVELSSATSAVPLSASTVGATAITAKAPATATALTSNAAQVPAGSVSATAPAANGNVAESGPPSPKRAKVFKQKVTITKEGRKRVAPQLVTTHTPSTKQSQLQQPQQQIIHGIPQGQAETGTVLELSRPSRALPKGGVASLVVGMKRKAGAITADASGGIAEDTSLTSKKQTKDDKEIPEYIRPAVASPAATVAQVRLATPKVQTYFSLISSGVGAATDGPVLEVRNGTGNEQEPTKVIVSYKGHPVFIDFLPKYGHLCAGSAETFWAVSTEDGVIYIYSPCGRRLMPCMTLGCCLTFLESQGNYLLAVTNVGLVYVWDIAIQKVVISGVSLAPVLDTASKYQENGLIQAASITQAGVSDKGCVILSLSNGQGYTYNVDMSIWQRITESWWAFGSQYWNSTELLTANNGGNGIISLMERRTNQEVVLKSGSRARHMQRMAQNRMLQEGFQGFEGTVSIAHLENRIAAAIAVKSDKELRRYLIMYARRIGEEGMKERLDELCRELLGPVIISNDSDNGWQSHILDIPKHELLKDVLFAAGRFRDVQDIVVRYSRLVGISLD